MKKNMGSTDKIIRILVALTLALLIYFQVITGIISFILLAVAFIFVLTSLVGFCPLYGILGINTCSVKKTAKN